MTGTIKLDSLQERRKFHIKVYDKKPIHKHHEQSEGGISKENDI
jgi:hypothetical protein